MHFGPINQNNPSSPHGAEAKLIEIVLLSVPGGFRHAFSNYSDLVVVTTLSQYMSFCLSIRHAYAVYILDSIRLDQS